MWKKYALLGIIALIIAVTAILVVQSGWSETENLQHTQVGQKSSSYTWTSAPDWVLGLTKLRTMGLDRHWVAQLIEAISQDQSGNNQHEKAVSVLLMGYSLFPQNAKITYQLGLELCIVEPSRAVQYLSIAANLDSAYMQNVEEITKAIPEGELSDASQWVVLGKALGSAGEWTTAEVIFQKAIELAPNNTEAWVMIGQAQEETGQDGSGAFFQAEKLDPASDIVRASLASYYAGHGNTQKAIEVYSLLQQDEPDQPIWDIELGNLFSQTGDLVKAYSYFVSAIDLQPEKVSFWIAMVNFCVKYQIYIQEVGIPSARKAVNLEPDNPDALASMGEMLLIEGDADNAISFFTKAIEKDEHNSAYLYYLGESYMRANDEKDAYTYYVKAIEQEGNSGYGAVARIKLAQYFSIQPEN
jgi:tetratricopeptide (TPR) repeat protein